MAKSSYIMEMERRANDLLRVYNPTNEDYVVEWDRKNGTKLFRVSAKQEEVLPRYIAEKFIKEMYTHILTDGIEKRIIKTNQERIAKGMQAMNRWDEQLRFEVEQQMTVEKEAGKIVATLYVGLEREYGIDTAPQAQEQPKDDKSAFERALQDVQAQKDSGLPPSNSKSTENGLIHCDYPGCDFATEHRMGLVSHKRVHRKEAEDIIAKKEEAVAGVTQ